MKLETLATACLTLVTLVTLSGCDTLGDGAIGPEGGVVISEDGRVTIDIPADALAERVEITIEEVDGLPAGALGPSYRVEPVGLTFETPVQVLYNYSAEGMDVAPGDVTLVVERTDGWSELPDRTVWDDEDIVSASALYLSTFCAIER